MTSDLSDFIPQTVEYSRVKFTFPELGSIHRHAEIVDVPSSTVRIMLDMCIDPNPVDMEVIETFPDEFAALATPITDAREQSTE